VQGTGLIRTGLVLTIPTFAEVTVCHSYEVSKALIRTRLRFSEFHL